jgi:hypothetical protein
VYERAGFVVQPTLEWFVPPAAASVAGLMQDDELELPTRAAADADDFVIVPSALQLDWHLARERYYATARNRRAPSRHRLRLADSFVIVAADLKNGVLLGLMADVTSETVAPLLAAMGDLAWQLGLEGAKLWAPDGVDAPDFVTVRANESSLCMIRSARPVAWRRISRGAWV